MQWPCAKYAIGYRIQTFLFRGNAGLKSRTFAVSLTKDFAGHRNRAGCFEAAACPSPPAAKPVIRSQSDQAIVIMSPTYFGKGQLSKECRCGLMTAIAATH